MSSASSAAASTTTTTSSAAAADGARPHFHVTVERGTHLYFPDGCDVTVVGDVQNVSAISARLRLEKGATNVTARDCTLAMQGDVTKLTQIGGTLNMEKGGRVHIQKVTSGIGAQSSAHTVNYF